MPECISVNCGDALREQKGRGKRTDGGLHLAQLTSTPRPQSCVVEIGPRKPTKICREGNGRLHERLSFNGGYLGGSVREASTSIWLVLGRVILVNHLKMRFRSCHHQHMSVQGLCVVEVSQCRRRLMGREGRTGVTERESLYVELRGAAERQANQERICTKSNLIGTTYILWNWMR
ncbi:hypothetical protein BU16DRAFT_295261 [Lophium mytilinum]|uniref:Uncharacterized protein n=1 Tax=Lophium mytilinum TaxID=390894 RepID=A0A6A6R3Y5_9PEZI|nr:hypothetical protein BU16DRAFT_295261 [Lophium mytilinum]